MFISTKRMRKRERERERVDKVYAKEDTRYYTTLRGSLASLHALYRYRIVRTRTDFCIDCALEG